MWACLSPIASAGEGAEHIHVFEGAEQLLHGEGGGPVYQAIDFQLVLRPVDLGHGAMVAHVVQGGRGDEPILHQRRGSRLHIERVPVYATGSAMIKRTSGTSPSLCCLDRLLLSLSILAIIGIPCRGVEKACFYTSHKAHSA